MAAISPCYSSVDNENFQTARATFLGLLDTYKPYLKAENYEKICCHSVLQQLHKLLTFRVSFVLQN